MLEQCLLCHQTVLTLLESFFQKGGAACKEVIDRECTLPVFLLHVYLLFSPSSRVHPIHIEQQLHPKPPAHYSTEQRQCNRCRCSSRCSSRSRTNAICGGESVKMNIFVESKSLMHRKDVAEQVISAAPSPVPDAAEALHIRMFFESLIFMKFCIHEATTFVYETCAKVPADIPKHGARLYIKSTPRAGIEVEYLPRPKRRHGFTNFWSIYSFFKVFPLRFVAV